jgi:hypothetical protein
VVEAHGGRICRHRASPCRCSLPRGERRADEGGRGGAAAPAGGRGGGHAVDLGRGRGGEVREAPDLVGEAPVREEAVASDRRWRRRQVEWDGRGRGGGGCVRFSRWGRLI